MTALPSRAAAAHPTEHTMTAPASRSPLAEHTAPHLSEHTAQASRPWLSALADGDVDAVQQACDAWRSDAQARADWHTYHLIGDVLRSDDLAADPARDAQFLARLRLRLADEPVVLAPPAEGPTVRRRPGWLVPLAAAAGVAAVASVLVLAQSDPQGQAPAAGWALQGAPTVVQGLLASDSSARLPDAAEAGAGVGAGAGATGNANARVLRNARLDHYLEAHRGALGAAVAVPGGAMRNAEVIVPAPEQR